MYFWYNLILQTIIGSHNYDTIPAVECFLHGVRNKHRISWAKTNTWLVGLKKRDENKYVLCPSVKFVQPVIDVSYNTKPSSTKTVFTHCNQVLSCMKCEKNHASSQTMSCLCQGLCVWLCLWSLMSQRSQVSLIGLCMWLCLWSLMYQRSQVSGIGLWSYSLNVFVFVCVIVFFLGQVMSSHHSDQMSQMSQVCLLKSKMCCV